MTSKRAYEQQLQECEKQKKQQEQMAQNLGNKNRALEAQEKWLKNPNLQLKREQGVLEEKIRQKKT